MWSQECGLPGFTDQGGGNLESEVLCCALSVPQTLQKPNPELKQQLTGHSKRVAGSVTELIQAAEAMKGKQ